ncbi:MAG TPA: YafY family protein [Acidimicrobiales bacterium]|nr:YafY family protein [Acidimicrobiales bacterium]
MLETSARLLRLLSLLQARPVWTAPALAERLEVTERTIRRDVARLRDLGYPVDAEPGPHGGYRLGRGGALPPLLLDDDEAVAVAVGLRAAAGGGVTGIDDATVSALAKLTQVLPARLAARVAAVHGATAELRGRDPDSVGADLLVTLSQACRGGDRLRLAYADRDGRGSERLVDPLRLVRAGPRWYLVARDVARDAWRTFRVDRIASARSTGARAEVADPPDAVGLVARGMAVAPYAVVARVRIDRPAAAALDVIPRTVGVHTPDGDAATVVEVGGSRPDGLARYLAGLAVPVTVLDPPEVRAALRDHVRALLERNPDAP